MEENLGTEFQDEPEIVEDAPEQDEPEEESPEPEQIDEDEVVHQRVEKPKITVKSRIASLTREKYQALEIAEQIRQENEALRQQMLQSQHRSDYLEKASMSNYSESSQLRLNEAKQAWKQASEVGDLDAAAEAQEKIASIAAEIQSLKSWQAKDAWEKEQQRARAEYDAYQAQTYQQQQQQAPQQPNYTPESQTWLQSNPWFTEGTPDYHPELAEKAQDYADSLDQYYYNRGEAHKIGRAEYFNAINAHVRELTGDTQRRAIPMRNSRIPVSPVRSNSGFVSQSGNRQKAPLPSEHQEMMSKYWKIPEKDYRREYDADLAARREAYRSERV